MYTEKLIYWRHFLDIFFLIFSLLSSGVTTIIMKITDLRSAPAGRFSLRKNMRVDIGMAF